MTAVGGFFELELPQGNGGYHTGALALQSGRACLRLMLEAARPRRVLVPFFICDSALVPFELTATPVTFYGVTPSLEPQLPSLSEGDWILYVNYFGLKGECAVQLQDGNTRVIVDDTQAFFQRGYARAWSFNSARKFFGVPDGAYAYGDRLAERAPEARVDAVCIDHLVNRLAGRHEVAYRQYLEHEKRVSADVQQPSALAERILSGIDYDRARERRRRNFAFVHKTLGRMNTLAIALEPSADAVPYCYPFLPEQVIAREPLWRSQIFVPELWPELATRPAAAFAWERDLAARLLPLPIDHRYGAVDMERMCDLIVERPA